jgi:signal transduction histidine kinase
VICVISVICIDGIIGVKLFRSNAERIDIIDGIMRIRDGEVDYKLDVDSLSGTNRDMADAVNNIGEGIRKAVHTSMKDEQMKSDLITNVSHDIKTPLTSIINYVDLLKRLKIEEEPAKNYIDILDEKSQRLKQLTEDLLEASKISSGNITLNMEKLNLTELLNQTIGEFSEKLEERGLFVVFEDNNVPAYINADSRRMWRIADNLFNNIYKYALENTRIYVEISLAKEDWVELSIKNISASRMNIKGDELTERFIRGDSSRTTEGSGLGLFISKSLTEVQNGTFEIKLDGDLFKVILDFPQYTGGDGN